MAFLYAQIFVPVSIKTRIYYAHTSLILYLAISIVPLISPNPTDKNIIMYQLKPFKHYIYKNNNQLDDNYNVF